MFAEEKRNDRVGAFYSSVELEILNNVVRQIRWHEIRRRKSEGGQKFLPPTPFLFARPSVRISEFSIRIFVKKSSDFNQKAPPNFSDKEKFGACLPAGMP